MKCSVVSWSDVVVSGKLWLGQHHLRNKEFVTRQTYDVCSHDGLEWDQFDGAITKYIIAHNSRLDVYGVIRLYPTAYPHMINTVWADKFSQLNYASERVWEATRICVDSSLPPPIRRLVLLHLLEGAQQYCLKSDILNLVGVMRRKLWKVSLVHWGVQVDEIGVSTIDNREMSVGLITISQATADHLRSVISELNPPKHIAA